jgi:hypothetical protein
VLYFNSINQYEYERRISLFRILMGEEYLRSNILAQFRWRHWACNPAAAFVLGIGVPQGRHPRELNLILLAKKAARIIVLPADASHIRVLIDGERFALRVISSFVA